MTLRKEYFSDDDIPCRECLCLGVHHDGPGVRLGTGGGEVGGGRQDVLQLLYPVHPEVVR